MRRLLVPVLAAALACARAPLAPGEPAETPPEAALPRDVRPVRYALELRVDPSRERFEGAVAIDVELQRARSVVWLHARDLDVREAWVDAGGARIAAKLKQATPDGVARLEPERPLEPGRATIHVAFAGDAGERMAGLFRVRSGQDGYVYLQAEPQDARRAYPCFDDPAFRTPFQVTLVVPRGDRAVSNAPAESEERDGESTRVRFAATPPLPTYLVFAAVGPFEVVGAGAAPPGALRSRPLPLRFLAPRGGAERAAFALEATRELVPLLEARLGTAFPYEKLDAVVAPGYGGGMENAGAILYGDEVLDAGAPGVADDRRAEVADLVAHEVAHQWLGDRTGFGSWQDLWLGESFATLVAWDALERWRPELRAPQRAATEIDAVMDLDALPGAHAIRAPARSAADVERQFDPPAYAKGAALLRGYRRLIGADRFAAGLREHLATHAHAAATTDEFLATLSRAAGRDLAPALRSALDTPGVPLVEARPVCERGAARLELTVGLEHPAGAPARPQPPPAVPVCARWEAAGVLGAACALVEGGRGVIGLPACPRWVMPAEGGDGYYRWTLPPAELARLREVGFAHLTALERLALAQSLRAAARAGRLPYGDVLAALEPLTRDGDREVATAAVPLLAEAVDHLVPKDARAAARARAADYYRPCARDLGLDPAPSDAADRRLLRRDVAAFLVEVAHDPDTTRALATRGVALAGLAGRARPEAVAPELAEVALAAAVVQGDAERFEALAARLRASDDPEERAVLVGALGAARAPATSSLALELAEGTALRPDERARLVLAQAAQPETREGAWKTLQKRWDVLAPALFGDDGAALVPLAGALCDRDRIPAVRRALGKRAEATPGLALRIPEALEAIERCAALRDAQGASAAAYLAGG